MPADKVFDAGGLASTYFEIARWIGEQTADMQVHRAIVPFAGFGRMASAVSGDDVTVDTVDFQRLTSCVITGILGAKTYDSNVDKPRFHKGRAYEGKLIKNLGEKDPWSAGFLDWCVDYGTALDVACAGMVLPSQTYHGYMTKWTGNFEHYYKRFVTMREAVEPFVNMPGNWNHYEADFFSLRNLGPYDLIAVDPPVLSGAAGQDAYTRGVWQKLDNVLGGTIRPTPWKHTNYFALLRRLLDTPSKYYLFTWQEGYPPTDKIKETVCSRGTLELEEHWEGRGNKSIYGWRVKRNDS